jgi:hypothetical protein
MNMQRNVLLVLLTGMLNLTAVSAFAFDLGEIAIHGFVTQTFAKSTANQIFTLDTEGGSVDWFEAGINFTVEPVDGLRIGMQLYGQELGAQGNGRVVIDWATGDYRWQDWLGFRIGKNKMTFGLYNTARDADMARLSILLPPIYPETLRDLMNAYIGGEVYGAFSMGSGGDLDYVAFGGTMDLDDAFVIGRFMERGAEAGLRALPMPLEHASFTVNNINANMDHIYGGAIRWQTPLDGLLLQGTWHTSESYFSSSTTYSGWMGPIPTSITLQTETTHQTVDSWVLSAEYISGNFFLVGEYWEGSTRVKNVIGGLPFPLPEMPATEQTTLSYYLQAGYRLNDWFQFGGYYSKFYDDKNDMDGSGLEMRGQPAYLAWQNDLTLTTRFDINKHWLVKLEAHLYDGAASVEPMDNPDGIEENWTLFLARITFHF